MVATLKKVLNLKFTKIVQKKNDHLDTIKQLQKN